MCGGKSVVARGGMCRMPVPLGEKLGLRGDLVCGGRYICLVEKIRRAFRSGFCVWGEKCVFVRVGKAFLCTKKGYYTPLIIVRRCPT